MAGKGAWRHDRGMDLPAPLTWLVDEAGASPGPDRFLAEFGGRLVADGLPLAGGALTLAVPHPIIARRTWLWRAETGAVIEALGFAGGTLSQAGRDWLAGLGPVQEDTMGPGLDSPVLGWAGIRLRCPSLGRSLYRTDADHHPPRNISCILGEATLNQRGNIPSTRPRHLPGQRASLPGSL